MTRGRMSGHSERIESCWGGKHIFREWTCGCCFKCIRCGAMKRLARKNPVWHD